MDYSKREINKSVYNKNNPYGYLLNINHPKIRKLYERYKKWKGLPATLPLTDAQRFEFERYILRNQQDVN